MEPGAPHSEGTAEQIEQEARRKLIDELAEQARNGGARKQAEDERLLAEWIHDRRQKFDPDYDGVGNGVDFGGGGDCGGGGCGGGD